MLIAIYFAVESDKADKAAAVYAMDAYGVILLGGLKPPCDIVSVRKFPFPELTRNSVEKEARNNLEIYIPK
jgi:hypothetical protein